MRSVKFVVVLTLSVVFLGTLLGGTGLNVETPVTSEDVAGGYFETLKSKFNQGISEYELVAIVDSLLDKEEVDPRIISFLNSRIEKEYGSPWPIDTNAYPAGNHYHSWNTLQAHPYKNNISRGDTEVILSLTDSYMDCGYEHPFKGVVTSRFGWRGEKHHNGIDIDLVRGDTVNNVFRGVVRLAKWTGGYGRTVVVRHHNGLETIYAHLYKIFVKTGDVIDPGQALGRGGNSGASRGSHLHFETRFKGKAINPESLIDFKGFSLISDSLIVRKTRAGYVSFQPGTQFHAIKNGDFLYKIATKYGVSVKQMCKWNNIKRSHLLIVGKSLRVSE
jgi:LysM repeat protein